MAYTYTNEIANAGIKNVIPSYAPFSEAYFYLQEATENDWAELTRSIGLYELGVLEATGSEVVYEANDDSEAAPKNKITKFFADAWARIKGLFDKAIQAIQEACNKAKEKFKNSSYQKITLRLKAEKDAKDKDGNATKEEISYGKYYTYDKLTFAQNKSFESLKGTSEGEGSIDNTEEYLRGSEIKVTRNWLLEGDNWNNLVDAAFEFKFTKKSIISNYTAVKKAFDDAVKAAKSGKDIDASTIVHSKEAVTKLNKYSAKVCKIYHERQRLALAVIAKVIVHTMKKSQAEKDEDRLNKQAAKEDKEALNNAGKKPEKSNEAAVVESYTSDIGKLFDWDF